MGVNSSIEGSNPSFSVAHPSPRPAPARQSRASPPARTNAKRTRASPSRCARPLRGTGSSPPRLLVPLRPSCASAAPSHHHPFGVDEFGSLDQGIPRDARRPDGRVTPSLWEPQPTSRRAEAARFTPRGLAHFQARVSRGRGDDSPRRSTLTSTSLRRTSKPASFGKAPCNRPRDRRLGADGGDDAGAALGDRRRGDDQAGPRPRLLVCRLHDDVIVQGLQERSMRCGSCTIVRTAITGGPPR